MMVKPVLHAARVEQEAHINKQIHRMHALHLETSFTFGLQAKDCKLLQS